MEVYQEQGGHCYYPLLLVYIVGKVFQLKVI